MSREAEQHMRVLHVVQGVAFAGSERHVLALARELRKLGCDSEVACPGRAFALRQQADFDGVPTRSLMSALRCAPDVIHAHDGRSALFGAGLATVTRAAFVRTQHFVRPASVERTGRLGQLTVALHKLLNRRLDGYICVSEAVASAARDRHDSLHAPLTVIPSGVELSASEDVSRYVASRSEAPYPVVMSAGRLESERRFDVLIDAIPRVRDAVPGCHFVIAGSGSAEATLKSRAQALGVEDAVRWTGWLPEIESLFGSSHVYVNTWPWEGFGMATAEAMGSGLPVIVGDSGASPELIEPGVTGVLVPPADSEALATALSELLADRGRMATMGAAGRERAVARYSMHATAERTLDFYRQLPRIARER